MRKSLVALAVAGLAAATVITPAPAEAKGKGFGVGLGVGLVVGGIIASQHHHHHRPRPVYVQPQPYPTAVRPQQPVAPVIRTADDQGRFYDAASKTWFDGRSQCFTGAAGWTFRSGTWFYGNAAWTERGGVWQASTGQAPAAVDCNTVPSIAARLPKEPTDKTAAVLRPTTEDHAAATPAPSTEPVVPTANSAVDGAAQAGIAGGGATN